MKQTMCALSSWFCSNKTNSGEARRRSAQVAHVRRPVMERLEERQLMSAVLVTNTSDNPSVVGSLRWAIGYANQQLNCRISFAIPGSGPEVVIYPASALPALAYGTMIDGASEAPYLGRNPSDGPTVRISGVFAPLGTEGLTLTDVCSVSGLAISGFNDGIRVIGQDARIGRDWRNVISSNYGNGILLDGAGAKWALIENNWIGLNATGTGAAPNGYDGVALVHGAHDNRVEHNVISGNSLDGVGIFDAGTMNNMISGNFIGVSVNGAYGVGNRRDGVRVSKGAGAGNMVGKPGAGNVISGNGANGVFIDGASRVTVQSNWIGLDAYGTRRLGNSAEGVCLAHGAVNNTIGVQITTGDCRNVISANGLDGIGIFDAGTQYNTISGNYIGLSYNGSQNVGNGRDGVRVANGAGVNYIGKPGLGNVISGNYQNGVLLAGVHGVVIQGNWIGLDGSGTFGIGNRAAGIALVQGAYANTIGGNGNARNVISSNVLDGIGLYDSGTSASSTIKTLNLFGTRADGTGFLPNWRSDVYIGSGATWTQSAISPFAG